VREHTPAEECPAFSCPQKQLSNAFLKTLVEQTM
jgi:hypothetical protein